MSNLILDNSNRPTSLNLKYAVQEGRSVKVSVSIGNARTGTPFFFLDGESVITEPGVVVTPRTVTFADGKTVRGKVLTIAANVAQGTAVGSTKWSMNYILSGGNPNSKADTNSYNGNGPIVYFEDTITFQ